MSSLAPLVPAEVDLRAYDWFPLKHKQLLRSEWWLRASDQAKALNVELWCKSYEEVPAASLPDDDVALSDMVGFGRRDLSQWLAVKAEVLSPWTLCSDGRWYHATLAEVALDAWAQREKKREKERTKKRKQRGTKVVPGDTSEGEKPENAAPEQRVPQGPPGVPQGKRTTRQDTTGQEDKRKSSATAEQRAHRALAVPKIVWPSDAFDVFWSAYPEKVKKPHARKSFEKLAKDPPCSFGTLMDGLDRYIALKPPDRSWAHPASWLNAERWDDQPATIGGPNGARPSTDPRATPAGRERQARVGSMLEGAMDALDRRRR